MITKPKTYVTKVVADEDGQLVMLFPEELLKALDLQTGEILVWAIDKEQTVHIKRTRFIDNTQE